jgi:signal transduction histidine kinase
MDSSSKEHQYTELLSLAVHEFRTPASVVGGYLRMLQRDSTEPLTPKQAKMVDEAARSCARLVELIGELSDISKLDSGAIDLQRKPLDLTALLTEVAAHVHEAKDRDVHLALQGVPEPAPMIGDAGRLTRAFDAVFRAILREKAGPATVAADHRRVEIDGRRWSVVVVADANVVQESYERPRGVFNEKRGGLGLALPLARRVFEGHGGRIWSPASSGGDPERGDPVSWGSAIVTLPLTE